MITLSQRDPKWADKFLGSSKLTIGKFGCTTCCISMLSDFFGCYKDPVEIQKYQSYTNIDHPQGAGLILWDTLHLGPMKFEKRLYSRNDAEIQKSLKDPKKAVILEVDGKHWVVATGKVPLTNVYTIRDPWFGDRSTTLRYKKITGSAHYYSN